MQTNKHLKPVSKELTQQESEDFITFTQTLERYNMVHPVKGRFVLAAIDCYLEIHQGIDNYKDRKERERGYETR